MEDGKDDSLNTKILNELVSSFSPCCIPGTVVHPRITRLKKSRYAPFFEFRKFIPLCRNVH